MRNKGFQLRQREIYAKEIEGDQKYVKEPSVARVIWQYFIVMCHLALGWIILTLWITAILKS